MKWERWHSAVLGGAALVAGVLLFWKSSGSSPDVLDAGTFVLAMPAKAPENLLAEASVPTPNASWSRLQRGIGGAVGILPMTLPGVVVALTDLDAELGSELDGASPMFVVAAGDPADPGICVAMKLVDGRRARGALLESDVARNTGKALGPVRPGLPPEMTLLVPKGAIGARRFAVAITGNGFLVIGRTEDDLEKLAPYATRTLAAKPLPDASRAIVVDVPRSAIKALLVPKVEAIWKEARALLLAQDERMRAERGRAPDFGEPAAIVAAVDELVRRRVAVLGDLDTLRLSVDVKDDAVGLDLRLHPLKEEKEEGPARKWIGAMKTGDAAEVLALPATSLVAIGIRDGEAERAEQASDFEKNLRASLGPRLKEPEKLHGAVEAMAKARDEALAFAVSAEEPGGLFLRAPVRDADASSKALRGFVELARVDPFREILRVRELSIDTEDIAPLGKSTVATLTRNAPGKPGADAGGPAKAAPGKLGAAWTTIAADGKSHLVVGGGSEAPLALKLGAKPDKTLGDEPLMKRFTSSLGSDASTLVLAQPLRLDPKRANLPTAPLGVAIGRKNGDAFVQVEVADPLLREAARWQMGL